MNKPLDSRSKLGRAVFTLVDASAKVSPDLRGRVARVRNLIEATPEDAMVKFKIDGDLSALAREPRLSSAVMMLRKSLPT